MPFSQTEVDFNWISTQLLRQEKLLIAAAGWSTQFVKTDSGCRVAFFLADKALSLGSI
jgi:hypothetical protein